MFNSFSLDKLSWFFLRNLLWFFDILEFKRWKVLILSLIKLKMLLLIVCLILQLKFQIISNGLSLAPRQDFIKPLTLFLYIFIILKIVLLLFSFMMCVVFISMCTDLLRLIWVNYICWKTSLRIVQIVVTVKTSITMSLVRIYKIL